MNSNFKIAFYTQLRYISYFINLTKLRAYEEYRRWQNRWRAWQDSNTACSGISASPQPQARVLMMFKSFNYDNFFTCAE